MTGRVGAIAILALLVQCGAALSAMYPHPRVFLTPRRLARIQQKAQSSEQDFVRAKTQADIYIAAGGSFRLERSSADLEPPASPSGLEMGNK